jgi:hypothetical protein
LFQWSQGLVSQGRQKISKRLLGDEWLAHHCANAPWLRYCDKLWINLAIAPVVKPNIPYAKHQLA